MANSRRPNHRSSAELHSLQLFCQSPSSESYRSQRYKSALLFSFHPPPLYWIVNMPNAQRSQSHHRCSSGSTEETSRSQVFKEAWCYAKGFWELSLHWKGTVGFVFSSWLFPPPIFRSLYGSRTRPINGSCPYVWIIPNQIAVMWWNIYLRSLSAGYGITRWSPRAISPPIFVSCIK